MNLKKPAKYWTVILPGTFLVVFVFSLISSESVQAGQKRSEELLLKIMDMHSELVSNEIFLAQAKLLGAYIEAAQQMDDQRKVEIYTKVLSILSKIKLVPVEISTDSSNHQMRAVTQHASMGKEENKSVYEPGAALLEIFKVDSFDTLPTLPVIRTYWNRELSYDGGFLVPERALEIGRGDRYVAQFSFYYEAKKPGRYGFSVVHNNTSSCKLIIGGVEIFNSKGRLEIGSSGRDDIAAQGVCILEKGFHRLEFFIFSKIYERYSADYEENQQYDRYYRDASFQVKVLTPDGFDAAPITKDVILLKKE